jgi:hypothetical protein
MILRYILSQVNTGRIRANTGTKEGEEAIRNKSRERHNRKARSTIKRTTAKTQDAHEDKSITRMDMDRLHQGRQQGH